MLALLLLVVAEPTPAGSRLSTMFRQSESRASGRSLPDRAALQTRLRSALVRPAPARALLSPNLYPDRVDWPVSEPIQLRAVFRLAESHFGRFVESSERL